MMKESEANDFDEATYYPQWLGQSILMGDYPWNEAASYSVAEFLATYTLHDSVWIQIKYDVAYDDDAILIIRWDSVWLPDKIAQSTALVAYWPILFIKLEGATQISMLGYENIGGLSRGISTAEIETIEGKNVFVIHDHYGGSVEIVFTGGAQFLAFDRGKNRLAI